MRDKLLTLELSILTITLYTVGYYSIYGYTYVSGLSELAKLPIESCKITKVNTYKSHLEPPSSLAVHFHVSIKRRSEFINTKQLYRLLTLLYIT